MTQLIRSSLIFCFAIGVASCESNPPVSPANECTAPAPIHNTRDPRSPSISVYLKSGIDRPGAIGRLTGEFGFTVIWIPQDNSGFLTTLNDAQIAGIRCDSAVAFLEWSVLGMTALRAR